MRRARRALAPVACVVAGLVVLAGCSGVPAAEGPLEEPATATSPEPPGGLDDAGSQRYVALGDSFTSGPLVPTTDLADGCLRSDGNYPSLLATSLDLDLYDASDGHDVCSPAPWVNGRTTEAGVALAFHPLATGMQGVAAELEALLAEG